MKFKKFDKDKRGGFLYTFYHWLAFNYTAKKLKCWKIRFLLHDIEKPWLMLLWRDYDKVQKWHRRNRKHHIEYHNPSEYDYLGMVIDWECSHLTKIGKEENAVETYKNIIDSNFPRYEKEMLSVNIPLILHELDLLS